MSSKPELVRVLTELGRQLGFEVGLEIEAAASAWVDLVWFDSRLSPSNCTAQRVRAQRHPVLPVVGFEIEFATGANAKHVKSSVSNLNNLAPSLGVLVIGSQTFSGYNKRLKSGNENTVGDLLDRIRQ